MRGAIRKIITGGTQYDSVEAYLVCVISRPGVEDSDPSLMLGIPDSIGSADYVERFLWHPHQGIEVVTYLIEGTTEHGDSPGSKGSTDSGCCQ